MNDTINKSEWDFFVTALTEEALTAIWETGASVAPIDLINSVLGELQALAPQVDGQDLRSDEQVWRQLREVLLKAAYLTRPYCVRCGTCCTKGSPTLVKEDIRLFNNNVLKPVHVLTIREGETAHFNTSGEVGPARTEMIKIREIPETTTCIFYGEKEKNCSIYEFRPEQCRLQECWAPEKPRNLKSQALNRQDILGTITPLWEVIQRHEERCSHREFQRAMTRLAATKGQTVQDVLSILSFDHSVRQFLRERLSLDPKSLDFFVGRSLRELIGTFDLMLEELPDGHFLLTPSSS